MTTIMKLLYILFCLVIIISISIYLTKKKLESFASHINTYESTKNSNVGEIDILGISKFSPDCCPNIYTTSSGCLCNTNNENVIISSRGGNKCCS
jgi:hypothetical protein